LQHDVVALLQQLFFAINNCNRRSSGSGIAAAVAMEQVMTLGGFVADAAGSQ